MKSGLRTKTSKPVWQVLPKIVALGLCLVQAVFMTQASAAVSVALSDDELDGVYAEGISFNFDVTLIRPLDLGAQMPAIPPVIPEAPQADSAALAAGASALNTVLVAGGSQEYLSSLVNINAAGSVVPVLLNLVVNIDSTAGSIRNSNSLNSANFYNFNVAPEYLAIPTGTPAITLPAMPRPLAPVADVSGAWADLTPEVTAPDIGTAPNILFPSSAPEVIFPSGMVPAVTGMNTVIVAAQAQQHLSALVNVNAAGSVVPVLLNLVININSKIQEISNENHLNLDQFYKFNIQ